jgi:hypothetical protein
MERVAVITDIHANLPALEAALERIDELDIESVYCGGDLVGYGPHPNDVCALIQERGIPTIYGNYDYAIARDLEDCGCAYIDQHDREAPVPVPSSRIASGSRSALRKRRRAGRDASGLSGLIRSSQVPADRSQNRRVGPRSSGQSAGARAIARLSAWPSRRSRRGGRSRDGEVSVVWLSAIVQPAFRGDPKCTMATGRDHAYTPLRSRSRTSYRPRRRTAAALRGSPSSSSSEGGHRGS